MRVAIVHDWLYVLGGAERVLTEILKCFPDADVFSLFDALSAEDKAKIGVRTIKTSFLQKMPFIARSHRLWLPLMPLAIEQLDLSSYDLVISSSYAVAKGVITGPNQLHVAYVHSPMRYAWDLQNEYLRQMKAETGLKSAIIRMIMHHMRIWDARTAHGPDVLLANSLFVARRIKKFYGRTAQIINPPVDLSPAQTEVTRKNYFFAASRLVIYKNIHLIVEAFSKTPDLNLIVAGAGPMADQLKNIAGPNIAFKGFVSDAEMRLLMREARAFVFAAEEDFGIVPVEAQAEGTPVLALGRGGALETVKSEGLDKTGMFFSAPTPESIIACVRAFIAHEAEFSRIACREQAERFSAARFRKQFTEAIRTEVSQIEKTYPSLAARLTIKAEA